MLRKLISITALVALLLCLCACSAKANSTYTGTVASVSGDSITLETDDGKVTIKVTANTPFTMGGFGGMDISSLPIGASVTVITGADKTASTISMSMNFGDQMPDFQN